MIFKKGVMTTLKDQFNKIYLSKQYSKVTRSSKNLVDFLSLSQFYYTSISTSGKFFCIATNPDWEAFLYDNLDLFRAWPFLRHPDILKPETIILKNYSYCPELHEA